MASHFSHPDSPSSGRRRRAVCGTYIDLREHSTEPNCEQCLDWLAGEPAREAADDAALAELQAMPSGPEPTLNTFDSLAGYRPKGIR